MSGRGNKDPLLLYLCNVIGDKIPDGELEITLFIGDVVVNGYLVSAKFAKEYVHGLIYGKFVTDLSSQEAESQISNAISSGDNDFIHLSGVRIFSVKSPEKSKYYENVLRIKIDSVDSCCVYPKQERNLTMGMVG